MEFRNSFVEPAALPAVEMLALLPLSGRFPVYQVLGSLIRWGVLVFAAWLVPVMGDAPPQLAFLVATVFAIVGLILTVLAWFEARGRAYALREHDLIYRKGLFVRSTMILPLARIQHVETVSGPLERLFKLVRLTCYTAGGSSADLVMAGLERATAERVRQFLLHQIRHRADSSVVNTDAALHHE